MKEPGIMSPGSTHATPETLFAQQIREIVLRQSKRAHVGHIGSALSIADVVASLYCNTMDIDRPDDPDRDRFVLSKGHASLAVYAALHLRGWITEAQLNSYCGDESLLGVHPEHALDGIDFCTGSLGQGLSLAAGAALGARMQGSRRRVFALISDAECNEGSTWEASAFAAHHKLSNLITIVDMNGQQALGYTRDVMDMSPLEEKWNAFGWNAQVVDGHDVAGIKNAIEHLDLDGAKPHVLVARTTFGKGVDFMQGEIKWHYLPMSDQQYEDAIQQVGGAV